MKLNASPTEFLHSLVYQTKKTIVIKYTHVCRSYKLCADNWRLFHREDAREDARLPKVLLQNIETTQIPIDTPDTSATLTTETLKHT